jgi:hypothetical protein
MPRITVLGAFVLLIRRRFGGRDFGLLIRFAGFFGLRSKQKWLNNAGRLPIITFWTKSFSRNTFLIPSTGTFPRTNAKRPYQIPQQQSGCLFEKF